MSAMEDVSPREFRILVVDDEVAVLEVMVEMLQAAGWTVDALSSGVEAVQRIKRSKYDALVLDLYMPDIPGLLLHSKLKFIDRDLWNRTIFVSGHFSTDELRKALEGSPRFVGKPFKARALIETVELTLPQTPRGRGISDPVASSRGGDTPVRS